MDFRYSEEQLALQDTLQRFISRDYDFEHRRVDLTLIPSVLADYINHLN